MKKETIIAILGTVVVAFVILMIVGLTMKDESAVYQESKTNYAKEGFMEGCTEEGVSNSICECMYNSLESEYGVTGIIKMADEIPDEALELVTDECL